MQDNELCGQVILVVEDKPLITRDMRESLEKVGARVLPKSLQEASEFIQQTEVSALVMDCRPVSRERRALIRQLRRRSAPFLFYGMEPPADVTTERDILFIAKPSTPAKMIAAIRYLTRK
jgi:DNA-binding response OmpR family regulator